MTRSAISIFSLKVQKLHMLSWSTMKNYKYNMVARDNSIFSLKIMESYSLFSNTKKRTILDTTQETKCKIVKLSHDDRKTTTWYTGWMSSSDAHFAELIDLVNTKRYCWGGRGGNSDKSQFFLDDFKTSSKFHENKCNCISLKPLSHIEQCLFLPIGLWIPKLIIYSL